MIRFDLQKKLKAAHGEMLLDVQCEIDRGQVVVIYGASGAGKTSILRMLAGLLKPQSGSIEVYGRLWFVSCKKVMLKAQERKTGFVFQDYALFPNMTVRRNLEYALAKNQSAAIIDELIETVELGALQNRKPATLSGGQKQRVALARALVRQPEILLLDEPLSALDQSIRSKLQDYILKAHRKYQLTTILVSHDIAEIFKMAERVLVLEEGRIVQSGDPQAIFAKQASENQLTSVGVVMAVERTEGGQTLKILVGNQSVSITARSSVSYEVGEQVLLNWKADSMGLKKLDL